MQEVPVEYLMFSAEKDKGEHEQILHSKGNLDKIKSAFLPCTVAAPYAVSGNIEEYIDIQEQLPVVPSEFLEFLQIPLLL